MIEGVGLFLAGLIGGMVNAIAGGGSFITFPALMAAGVSPIAANATNTFASSAGYLSGAAGFRRELWARRRQLPKIAVSALVGGGLGAWLLLQTPENTFSRAIPWLLLLATLGQTTSTTRVPASTKRRASRQLWPKVFVPYNSLVLAFSCFRSNALRARPLTIRFRA